jgi:hypothetical protein
MTRKLRPLRTDDVSDGDNNVSEEEDVMQPGTVGSKLCMVHRSLS